MRARNVDVNGLERELAEFRDIIDGWVNENVARERRLKDAHERNLHRLEREYEGLIARERNLSEHAAENQAEAERYELEAALSVLGTIGAWRPVYSGRQPYAELKGLPVASELLTRVRPILRRWSTAPSAADAAAAAARGRRRRRRVMGVMRLPPYIRPP